MAHVHTIPVDATLTPDEAWREICLMGVRATDTGAETWAVIECENEECRSVAVTAGQRPQTADLMVTEPSSQRQHCLDILCVGCGWAGHTEPHGAPWPVFQSHACSAVDQ